VPSLSGLSSQVSVSVSFPLAPPQGPAASADAPNSPPFAILRGQKNSIPSIAPLRRTCIPRIYASERSDNQPQGEANYTLYFKRTKRQHFSVSNFRTFPPHQTSPSRRSPKRFTRRAPSLSLAEGGSLPLSHRLYHFHSGAAGSPQIRQIIKITKWFHFFSLGFACDPIFSAQSEFDEVTKLGTIICYGCINKRN
jgi:hypothetical protein